MATYLARLLNINGLSQSEAARHTGLYQPRISLLCSGHKTEQKRSREVEQFFRIANATYT